MRPIPSGTIAAIVLVAAAVTPLLPLTLAVFFTEEVLLKAIQILLRSCKQVENKAPLHAIGPRNTRSEETQENLVSLLDFRPCPRQ
jgi:hypothetical protein